MSKGQMERVIFDRAEGVTITTKYAELMGTTYPISGIVAVSSGKIPAQRGAAYVLALLGIATIAFGAMVSEVVMLGIGALVTASGVAWAALTKDKYAVKLVTAAGTADAFVSENKDLVAEVSLAIKTAISER